MKTLVIILVFAVLAAITYYLAQPKDSVLEDTKMFIENQKRKFRDDSIAIDHRMQIEIAKMRLEKATGKKDTLTNEERLKKAESDFK